MWIGKRNVYLSNSVLLMSIWATSPIWPSIKRSWISMLAIEVTLAPIFNWRDFSKPPVFVFHSVLLESQKMDTYGHLQICQLFKRVWFLNTVATFFCIHMKCIIWVFLVRFIYKSYFQKLLSVIINSTVANFVPHIKNCLIIWTKSFCQFNTFKQKL